MQKIMFLFLVSMLLVSSNAAEEPSVKVVKFDEVQKLMTTSSDQIQVINFWATWCKPCIKELPYFQAIHQKWGSQVDVTLISLDFADEVQKKVIPFVQKKDLKPKVLVLDELDYNSWIDRVDARWTGSIPATLIIDPKTGKRQFVEGEVTQAQIESMVQKFIKN